MVLPRLVKKVIGKMTLYQGGEREKYTHFRWVDMCKWQRVIPRHNGNPRYRIAHGWKIEYGSFNLEALNFLMHFREPGNSLYFCTYSYFLSFSLLSFFHSFSHSFIFCHTFGNVTFTSEFWFFILLPFEFFYSPLNSKIAPYLPPPPCLDVARPRAKKR
jgi:hypothetical protein